MPYRPRPIRYLRHWENDGWRLKVYGISAAEERPPEPLVTAGLALAASTLPQPPTGDGRHGVGFMGVHDGAKNVFVFVSWWAKIYELNHVLYRGTRGQPSTLAPVERTLFGCTWDLHVIAFERDAWISSIVRAGDEPDVERYLGATFATEA